MINSRFSIAIHILSLLSLEDGVTSSYIAASININPVLVRKEITFLKKARLLYTREGKSGGVFLNREPGRISLADVYKAVYKEALFAHARSRPNQQCRVGKHIDRMMEDINREATQGLLKKLGTMNVGSLTGA